MDQVVACAPCRDICPLPQNQHIIATQARKRIIPARPVQTVGPVTANQKVIQRRPQKVFDAGQDIGHIAKAHSVGAAQRSPDAGGESRVIGNIYARAAIHRVTAGAGDHDIIACQPVDPIRLFSAQQQVSLTGSKHLVGYSIVDANGRRQLVIGQYSQPEDKAFNVDHLVLTEIGDQTAQISTQMVQIQNVMLRTAR